MDSCFEDYIQVLKEVDSIEDDSERSYEITKRKKMILLNADFKSDINRVLENKFVNEKIKEIEQYNPNYKEKLEHAKKTIFHLFKSFNIND